MGHHPHRPAQASPRWRAAFLVFLGLTFHALPASSMYYILLERDGPDHCYLVEQPRTTMVTITYSYPAYSKVSTVTITAFIGSGSDARTIQSKQLDAQEGVFKFAAAKDGLHSFCISTERIKKITKLGLEVTYGEADAYYAELAKEAHIDVLEANIMKLNAHINHILNEADFMKDKEVVFHQQCERMNAAAMWWPILQVSILLLTGFIQVRHLKRFFKLRKLI